MLISETDEIFKSFCDDAGVEYSDFIKILKEKPGISIVDYVRSEQNKYNEMKVKLGLNEYQKRAMTTCTESSNNFAYMFMNLVGEVGEFASKCAKFIRKEKAKFRDNNQLCPIHVDEQEREDLRKELGDCLWQLSGLCSVMGWTLEEVAEENLAKLADRQKRHVIVGEGDRR